MIRMSLELLIFLSYYRGVSLLKSIYLGSITRETSNLRLIYSPFSFSLDLYFTVDTVRYSLSKVSVSSKCCHILTCPIGNTKSSAIWTNTIKKYQFKLLKRV